MSALQACGFFVSYIALINSNKFDYVLIFHDSAKNIENSLHSLLKILTFRSLNRTLAAPKLLSLGIKNKNFRFHFVLLSLIRNFAVT